MSLSMGKRLLDKELVELNLNVYGMTCGACAQTVSNVVAQQLGKCEQIDVNILSNLVRISFYSTGEDISRITQRLTKHLEGAGFSCVINNADTKKGTFVSEMRLYRRRLLIACVFSIPEILLCMLVMPFFHIPLLHTTISTSLPSQFTFGNVLEVYLVSMIQWSLGLHYAVKAFKNLKLGVMTMEFLVTIASFTCYFSSLLGVFVFSAGDEWNFFEASSSLILFVTLGKYLECVAKHRTRSQVSKLCDGMEKCIQAVIVAEDGSEQTEPVGNLKVGDVVLIKPGQYFPADGIVLKGESCADESLITGESRPIPKSPGNRVFAGAINGLGSLKVKVEHEYAQSTLSQVIQMVQQTSSQKPRVQTLAENLAAVFVPFVIVLSIATALMWVAAIWYWKMPVSKSTALRHAISVLTIACPCALSLATPTALLVGKGVAARHGILIKDETRLLDIIGTKRSLCIFFDKTGTLTNGKMSVQNFVILATSLTQRQLLHAVALLERHSEHLISRALLDYCGEHGDDAQVDNIRSTPGRGIEGSIKDIGHLLIGSRQFLVENNVYLSAALLNQTIPQEECGMMVVFVACDAQVVAYFVLSDSVKSDASTSVRGLSQIGSVEMLTGDQWSAARWIAESIGISRVYANMTPYGKAQVIAGRRPQSATIFIGDGINDGPALAEADLGIALGSGSSHLAQTAASVILLNTQVSGINDALEIGRTIRSTVHRGFTWALCYNLLALPIAAGAFQSYGLSISPVLSGLLMAFSSVSVIINALLIRKWKSASVREDQIKLIL